MPTTVHIPEDLLDAVDEEARALRISRNKFIVDALKSSLESRRDRERVPPEFIAKMKEWREDAERAELLEKMTRLMRTHRRSKKPIRF